MRLFTCVAFCRAGLRCRRRDATTRVHLPLRTHVLLCVGARILHRGTILNIVTSWFVFVHFGFTVCLAYRYVPSLFGGSSIFFSLPLSIFIISVSFHRTRVTHALRMRLWVSYVRVTLRVARCCTHFTTACLYLPSSISLRGRIIIIYLHSRM